MKRSVIKFLLKKEAKKVPYGKRAAKQVKKEEGRFHAIKREELRRRAAFYKAKKMTGEAGVEERRKIRNQLESLDYSKKYSSKEYGARQAKEVASERNVLKKKKIKESYKSGNEPKKPLNYMYKEDLDGGKQLMKVIKKYRGLKRVK